ncbi:hypothetical protein B7P43_G07487 [Cryptotermes secundus]|uniref:Uncharacterized protein n=1 Tax=Cryptotermes secundus TaxID=105785 RepID=A0A2J7PHX8_9NEOP|nr:hypothetical protein B7P43_G07487 [Cryptotermes secundus]
MQLLEMGLSTEEKVFIVEYYFRSYGSGRQTTCFLGFELPDVIVQKSLHNTRVVIWCAVSAHAILGPYFIEDEEGNALTITQECYRNLVIGPFLQDLKRFCPARDLHMNRQWYQQDSFSFQYCLFWPILYLFIIL